MQEKELVSKHSIRGYLSRRSTEELDIILNYYLEGDRYKNYGDVILIILEILEKRMEPFVPNEEDYRMMEKLLAYKPRTED